MSLYEFKIGDTFALVGPLEAEDAIGRSLKRRESD